MPDSLVNINFDLGRGLLAFTESLGKALIAEATQKDSPLTNLVSISMLEEVLRRTQYTSELVRNGTVVIPPFTSASLANMDLRRPVTEVAICSSSPNVLFALIGGTLFVSKDGARTWSATSRSAGLIAVDPVHPSSVYALRTTGLYASKDFGEFWSFRSDAVSHRSFTGGQLTVHPADYRRLLLADSRGVYVSSDQGSTWRNCFPERRIHVATRWYYAIDKKRVGTIVAAYTDEAIYVTDDWGQTWAEISGSPTGDKPHPGIMQPLVIDSETSSIWYADLGSRKATEHMDEIRGVFVIHDRGVTWDLVTMDAGSADWIIDYIEIVQHAERSIVYAATPSGTTFYSWDRGKNWSRITIDWSGLPEGVDNKDFWALAPVDALTNDGLLYLKTRQGLLKSIDNGRNWFY